MLQPAMPTWALVLLLLLGTAATAQPQAMRKRSVTLSAAASEPLPEVRVAAGIKTLIELDAPLDKDSVQVDSARVQLVDVGERSLIFVPLVTPAEQERWVLRVRYADGAQPTWVAFALVSHPREVDSWIEVVRPRQPVEDCRAELAEAQARCERAREAVWVLADQLGGSAVQAQTITGGNAEGWAYRLGGGVLLVVTPKKGAVSEPWTPTAAVLRSKRLPFDEVKVRAVHVRQAPLAPGEKGSIAVEADLPAPGAWKAFTLELRDAGGQGFTLDVGIPRAREKEESGP
jgi:uncharacterized protein (TIGR02268 family)